MRSLWLLMLACCGGSTATVDGGGTDGSQQADGALPVDTFSCNKAGECDVRPKSCCGQCGAPTKTDMIGVNWQRGGAYTSSVCSGAGCPACFNEPDPNLAPVCRSQKCSAIDVRTDDVSKCTGDTDCRLRYAGCCEVCASGNDMKLIALSVSGLSEYATNQCHPDAMGCPKCAVMYPPYVAARCNKMTNHCEVVMINASDAGTD